MTQPVAKPYVTYEEYCAAEVTSETKHEWLDGVVYDLAAQDMAGGTIEHGRLAMAIGSELRIALRDRPCNVFNSDVRVRVLETGLSSYPDVSVVCGRLEVDPKDDRAVINPVLLVEVLSDSTEAYDRGEKFAHYRCIPSLREYVMLSQHEPRIEVYRRTDRGRWELEEARSGQSVELTSVGCRLVVDDVYRDPLASAAAAST